MSEWWTYRLADFLLFAPETYYRLFELYNRGVWPLQIVAAGLGLAVLTLLLLRPAWAGRAIGLLLAAAWAWVAYGYFFARYATINWAATYFEGAFALEALLLLGFAAAGRLNFKTPISAPARFGLALFVFALLAQPLIGPLLGRPWSGIELFGLAPDPTALATLGVLLAAERTRWVLLLVPLLWCAVTGVTLWAMEAPDALLMPVTGAIVLLLAIWKSLPHRAPL